MSRQDKRITNDVLMPKIATVTSKMQITIPIRFARKYGLGPGSKVSLEVRNGSILVAPLPKEAEST